MNEFRLPLSGDVTQSINPWTFFLRAVGSQFGLVNINLGQSSAPELEARILSDVGSYGKQIGQIGDALGVLINHVKLDDLKPDEQPAIAALRAQLTQIDVMKAKRRDEQAAIAARQSYSG
jgi:hypothetical protein